MKNRDWRNLYKRTPKKSMEILLPDINQAYKDAGFNVEGYWEGPTSDKSRSCTFMIKYDAHHERMLLTDPERPIDGQSEWTNRWHQVCLQVDLILIREFQITGRCMGKVFRHLLLQERKG